MTASLPVGLFCKCFSFLLGGAIWNRFFPRYYFEVGKDLGTVSEGDSDIVSFLHEQVEACRFLDFTPFLLCELQDFDVCCEKFVLFKRERFFARNGRNCPQQSFKVPFGRNDFAEFLLIRIFWKQLLLALRDFYGESCDVFFDFSRSLLFLVIKDGYVLLELSIDFRHECVLFGEKRLFDLGEEIASCCFNFLREGSYELCFLANRVFEVRKFFASSSSFEVVFLGSPSICTIEIFFGKVRRMLSLSILPFRRKKMRPSGRLFRSNGQRKKGSFSNIFWMQNAQRVWPQLGRICGVLLSSS